MLRINWTQRKTNIRVRGQVGVKEEDLLCFIKRKLAKYCQRKSKPNSLVLSSIGELPGNTRKNRRKWLERMQGDTNGLTEARDTQEEIVTIMCSHRKI